MQKIKNNKKGFYFPMLDGLRFIAFLLVFFHHFSRIQYRPLEILKEFGWCGVELFFVLSSFLLTKLLVLEIKNKGYISMKNFFIRRILRIWPLYFLYIFMIVFFFNSTKDIDGVFIGRLLGLFTFSDNIWTSILSYNIILPNIAHLWTISLETQYYLVLPFIIPFLLKLKKKEAGLIILSFWLSIIIFRIIAVLLKVPHPFIWVLPIQGDAFVLGTLLGLGTFDNVINKINSMVKIIFGIALVIYSFSIPNITEITYGQIISYTIIAIGFVLIVNGIMMNKNKFITIIFGNPVIRYLGKISYGLYIFHFICIPYVAEALSKLSFFTGLSANRFWIASFTVTLIVTIVLSALSYELFEKHFLKLKLKVNAVSTRPI